MSPSGVAVCFDDAALQAAERLTEAGGIEEFAIEASEFRVGIFKCFKQFGRFPSILGGQACYVLVNHVFDISI